MSYELIKLRPDHDLQCYFLEPSAVAALSGTGADGFTVSGSWRQQFDWAVVEWARDNVFDHPALRNLPDGDMSGVTLSYEETRTNCIALDSTLYPTVDWPYLRVWAEGTPDPYYVALKNYATAVEGVYVQPTVTFELQGSITALDYIELAWLDQHFNYQVQGGDTLESAAAALAEIITANQAAGLATATASGAKITLTYLGQPGANGNRIGVYGTVHGAETESWAPAWGMFAGGLSPSKWRVTLDFANLLDRNGAQVPMANVRKMRWTWAADYAVPFGNFERCEFAVVVTNWAVSGTNLTYSVAGPGSRRIEDDDTSVSYSGTWTGSRGNYSGGSIHTTTTPGNAVTCTYTAAGNHTLYVGTRRLDGGARVTAAVDGGAGVTLDLSLPGEDFLVRIPLGQLAAGSHTVTVTHAGTAGTAFWFDFLEAAVPTANLPALAADPVTTLATDWDTDAAQFGLAPERAAWLIEALGFHGRCNHYAGALWWYELVNPGNVYATSAVTFAGVPDFGQTTQVSLGGTVISHLNLIGDTAESIAACFALLINAGSTGVWAAANGAVLTITSRTMGTAGAVTVTATTTGPGFTATVAATAGVDGTWLTDLTVVPRLNRAVRDWHASFFAALKGYGLTAAAALSMELGAGDASAAAGIAQRYSDGTACVVSTPALQTNFGPQSLAFWQQAYLDLANLMAGAGLAPYLQFGEVQWWYFAGGGGPSMPFYDAYTQAQFQAQYAQPMAVIASQNADPAQYPDECAFLPGLIGAFTNAVMAFVRQSYPQAKFEVLYPPDTNDTALNQVINYPKAAWTAVNLACLKTENFTYTGDRDLNKARQSIALPGQLGFPAAQSSHLVGIGDYTTPWLKERQLAVASGVESVVLFALDQFCLTGYAAPVADAQGTAGWWGA